MLQAFILLEESSKFFERICLAHWIEGNVQVGEIVVTFKCCQYLRHLSSRDLVPANIKLSEACCFHLEHLDKHFDAGGLQVYLGKTQTLQSHVCVQT